MSKTHTCREAAQVLEGLAHVAHADQYVEHDETPYVEATIASNRIDPEILDILSSRGLSIDPAHTATRGDPTHTILVAGPAP